MGSRGKSIFPQKRKQVRQNGPRKSARTAHAARHRWNVASNPKGSGLRKNEKSFGRTLSSFANVYAGVQTACHRQRGPHGGEKTLTWSSEGYSLSTTSIWLLSARCRRMLFILVMLYRRSSIVMPVVVLSSASTLNSSSEECSVIYLSVAPTVVHGKHRSVRRGKVTTYGSEDSAQ